MLERKSMNNLRTDGLRKSLGRRRGEQAVRHIAEATASVLGDRFMNRMVAACATTLGLDYAFVTETTPDPAINRMVAFWDDGIVRTDVAYTVSGTPAEAIYVTGDGVLYRRDVAARFPRLPWLSEHGVECFAGVPLRATTGELIGGLGVFGRRAGTDLHTVEHVLRMIAPRVAGELERARLLRAITERERVLHTLVERANDVLFRLEARGVPRLTYISPTIEYMSGYASDEFMRDPFLFFRVIDRAERKTVTAALMRQHRDLISARWVRADGSALWVEYSDAQMLDDKGKVVAVDGVIRDVTARVALERELRASAQRERDVITALPDMVFRLGADGTYRDYFESEAKRPFVPPAQFLGRNVAQILPEDVAVPLLRAMRTAIETGVTQRVEYQLSEDEGERYFESRIVPISQDEVLAFARDFTADRRMASEDERRVTRDELETRVESYMKNGNRYGLTFRELTVLHHVSTGLADKEIAEALGISTYTINKHVASILSKMQVTSRTAAGVQAVREGLLA